MAEMLGKQTGCCQGKGGSMHFTDAKKGLMVANAIVAAGVPHAAGAALAFKMQGTDKVAVAFFGEGAVNQGIFHETLNLSVVWKLPVIFICENNLYSEMTPSHETTSVSQARDRAAAYGMPAVRVDANDVELMYNITEAAVANARSGEGPTFVEAMTYRLYGHMMGDPEVYRTKEEVEQARQREPIYLLGVKLKSLGYSEAELNQLEAEAETIILDAVEFAEFSPAPEPDDAYSDVFL
jgi:pyruvate dehydrogenase E1 component alpha subunit